MDLNRLFEAIVLGDALVAKDSAREGLAEGIVGDRVVNDAMIPAMSEVGARFERGEYYLPDMLVAARAMQAALVEVQPHLMAGKAKATPFRVVIGTVKGDLHNIGKNLVGMMLQGAGFEIIDLGIDVAPAAFVDAVKSSQARVVALSALLTTTMPAMKATVDALSEAGIRNQVKVVVGGAPITRAFANHICAEGYAPDASAAVREVKHLLGL